MKTNINEEGSWSDSYVTGIPEIDRQHKGFFDLLDEAGNNLEAGDYSKLNQVIKRLEEYSEFHFDYEERLISEAGFKDAESHIEKHRFFIKKVEELKLEHSFLNPGLTGRLIGFMKKWFISHILFHDRDFTDVVRDYLNNRG